MTNHVVVVLLKESERVAALSSSLRIELLQKCFHFLDRLILLKSLEVSPLQLLYHFG